MLQAKISPEEGFTVPGGDYAYDANGNMTSDQSKGLSITYNYLNLPATVSKGQESIEWFYDATGRKLRKVSGTNSVTYVDGIEKYDNGNTFIAHPEGRTAVVPADAWSSRQRWSTVLRWFPCAEIFSSKPLPCRMEGNYLQKLNRSIVTIGTLDQDPLEENRFWLSKTPAERLIALELLRMLLAGYDNTVPRLQRFFTVTERA